MTAQKSNLVRLTAPAIKEHLRTFLDVDPEGDVEPRRLTLDSGREWYRVQCPDGHVHHITPPSLVDEFGDVIKGAKPKLGEVTFECHVDEPGKHPANTKFTITPQTKD